MFRTPVLMLLWLFMPLAHSFSWDVVVGQDKRLEFYYNGTLTHTQGIPSANHIISVTYDPVHYRVLFSDFNRPDIYISSFDLSTRKIQLLVTRKSKRHYVSVVYDPVTQILFWRDYDSLFSFSLNPTYSNKAVDVNIVATFEQNCWDIAVDSCGGYIYWVTEIAIERARFDGSEREVLIASEADERRSLAIDQQTKKMYWTETIHVNGEYQVSIESANLNGKNRTTLHTVARNKSLGYSLAVSKDFVYWKNYNQVGIWQLPKTPSQHVEGKLFSMSNSDCTACRCIAANYALKEQIEGIKSCEALQSLISNDSKSESSVSICQYYCFQGDCSVSAEGQPTCSCKAGYSGERCEVNACHKHCLNNGVCSLNEANDAVCECTADYEGERCDVAKTCTGVHAENTTTQVLPDLHKETRQFIKEELKRMLQFFSDKIDDYQGSG